MKKTIAFFLAFTMILSLILLCPARRSHASEEDPVQVITDSFTKLYELDSYHFDMDVTVNMDIHVSMSGQNMSLPLDAVIRFAMDQHTDPLLMKGQLDIRIATMGKTEKQHSLIYLDKNGDVITSYASTDDGTTWKVNRVDNMQVNPADTLTMVVNNTKEIQKTGTEMIDGREADVYTGKLDGKYVQEILGAVGSSSAGSSLSGVLGNNADMSNMGDIDMALYIDTQTHLPLRYTMDVGEVLTSLMGSLLSTMLGMEELEGMEINFDVLSAMIDCSFSQFNSVPLFEIPEDARAAAESLDQQPANEKLKIVNLVNGNLGDKSFFDSAESGLKSLQDDGLVEYRTIEMGLDESTWQNCVEEVASSKEFDIIVCGTWQMCDILAPVAQKYPDQLFIIYDTEMMVDGKYLPNVASIQYNFNELGYIVGVYAGLLETRSNLPGLNDQKILGFVGGEDSPVICDFLVGYIEGAQSVDPEIKVDFRWIGNYTDSALGKEIGAAEIEAGADIIWGVGGNAGTGAVEACYEKGVYFIGVDSDQEQALDPKYAAVTLTSGLRNVGASLEYIIKKHLEGDKSIWGNCTFLGLAEGCVGIATAGNFAKQAPEIRDAVNALKDKILSGEIRVDSVFDPNFDYYALMNAVKPEI